MVLVGYEDGGLELAWLARAFDEVTDFCAVLDDDGNVIYCNPFAFRLVGRSPGELIGTSMAEHLHPDDLVRALEVIGHLSEDNLGVPVTPAVYRIATADGDWLPIEVNASAIEHEGTTVVVLFGRYSGDRNLQDQIFELLTRGAPSHEVIELLPHFGGWRHPDEHYAIVYRDDDGRTVTVGSKVAAQLVTIDDAGSPWSLAAGSGEEVVMARHQMAAALESVASEHGISSLWAVPVDDPLHDERAVIVACCQEDGGATASHRYAIETMARSLTLALQWREHVTTLERAARRDALTGLTNRMGFFEALDQLDNRPNVAVLYVDLDGFKGVNDGHGHLVGDDVLVQVGDRIAKVLRPGDLVARLGGDEFAVLCTRLGDDAQAEAIASRLIDAVSQPYAVDGAEVRIGASVGIATASSARAVGTELLDAADRALLEAKQTGRGRWRFGSITTARTSGRR